MKQDSKVESANAPVVPDDMSAFLRESARIGSDTTLVQGAGGNASIKCDGAIWVKASGKWLAHAETEPILVSLDLEKIRRRLLTAVSDRDSLQTTQVAVTAGQLRPSIETTLHVVMPQKVVFHVHCVNTIAWSVRLDGRKQLETRLAGLDWSWIPYARPGMSLTRMIEAHRATAKEDVLILANHGLVVCGESTAAAVALLLEIQRRLGIEPRAARPWDRNSLEGLAAGTDYVLPTYDEVHSLAMDSVSTLHASGGTLYPDHVVFLGHAVGVLRAGERAGQAAERIASGGAAKPALILVPGTGTLIRAGLGRNAEEMARCLALVVSRIPAGTPLAYLDLPQEAELLDWDAEKYRRTLNA